MKSMRLTRLYTVVFELFNINQVFNSRVRPVGICSICAFLSCLNTLRENHTILAIVPKIKVELS